MKLIVTQKHMNLPKLIVVIWSAIVALSGNELSAKAADPQLGNSRRTFGDWCRQKADLSPETKHTVDLLLKRAGTNDCDAADRKLSSLTVLFLESNQIGDIKPLASLTNLKWLSLSFDQIGDIKPLASLTNLTKLVLVGNQIGDIKPLASLTNLTKIALSSNQIRDIKPLASLTHLSELFLDSNQIGDIKPLASLT
ncbi:leucine-rich repeat domain-containing protein, partial [Microcoleus sp. herbarium14]|uniref:leucine-rich repeat domain-containing protein n=1 Tax=Microcoleus sp. herbarium14 TaxID=3055439 RepID=UPI002FD1EB45